MNRSDLYKTISIPRALVFVHQTYGPNVRSIIPDDIAQAVGLDNPEAWRTVPNWEDKEDLDLLHGLGVAKHFLGRPLMIVTEASFSDNTGAFLVSGDDLAAFVESHLDMFGEMFFNGDVVIMDTDNTSVWLFHHEGAFALTLGSTTKLGDSEDGEEDE